MKTKTKITDITHEDLVELLSTCSYGSNIFMLDYNSKDYNELPNKGVNACTEDIMAALLLAGKSVWICDKFAEDKDEVYGNLPHEWDDDYETMDYLVSLNDIVKGIENALDGNFKLYSVLSDDYKALARNYATNLINHEEGNFDIPQAEALMQIILWNEWIYN